MADSSSTSQNDTRSAASLPDRSAPTPGRKRGTSADSESRRHETRAVGKRRQSIRNNNTGDSEDGNEEEE